MTELQKLLARAKLQSNGCLLIGNLESKARYWNACANGKWMNAHRAVWVLTFGEIPNGMMVLHKCDTTRCINTAHLFLGTQLDNIQDCISKGRKNPARGEKLSKITSEDVRKILALRGCGFSVPEIARAVPVSESAIYKIIQGTRWKHVPRSRAAQEQAA